MLSYSAVCDELSYSDVCDLLSYSDVYVSYSDACDALSYTAVQCRVWRVVIQWRVWHIVLQCRVWHVVIQWRVWRIVLQCRVLGVVVQCRVTVTCVTHCLTVPCVTCCHTVTCVMRCHTVPLHVVGMRVPVQSCQRWWHLHDVCYNEWRERCHVVVQSCLPLRVCQPLHLRHSQRLHLSHHGHLRDSQGLSSTLAVTMCVCVWMYVSKVIYNCRIKFKLPQVLRNITVYGMDKFLDVLWMWWVIV